LRPYEVGLQGCELKFAEHIVQVKPWVIAACTRAATINVCQQQARQLPAERQHGVLAFAVPGIVTQPSLSAGCMLAQSVLLFSVRHTACERNGTCKAEAVLEQNCPSLRRLLPKLTGGAGRGIWTTDGYRQIVAAEIYTGLQGWSGIRSNVPETCELPCWHSCIEGKADTINDSATANTDTYAWSATQCGQRPYELMNCLCFFVKKNQCGCINNTAWPECPRDEPRTCLHDTSLHWDVALADLRSLASN
jgi:hypothetical protein